MYTDNNRWKRSTEQPASRWSLLRSESYYTPQSKYDVLLDRKKGGHHRKVYVPITTIFESYEGKGYAGSFRAYTMLRGNVVKVTYDLNYNLTLGMKGDFFLMSQTKIEEIPLFQKHTCDACKKTYFVYPDSNGIHAPHECPRSCKHDM